MELTTVITIQITRIEKTLSSENIKRKINQDIDKDTQRRFIETIKADWEVDDVNVDVKHFIGEEQFSLEIGDTIQCANTEEMITLSNSLMKEDIMTGFLYEKDGQKGYWLEVVDDVGGA